MTEEDRVRGEIAIAGATAYFELWEKLTDDQRDNWRKWADGQVLSIKGLRIEADDQSLPEKIYGVGKFVGYILPGSELVIVETGYNGEYLSYGENVGMNKMLKDNWVKVIGGVK